MEAGPSGRASVGSPYQSDDSDSEVEDESLAAGTASSAATAAAKRKRRERACDHCRSRKVKCDGFAMHDQCCSLCRNQGRPCTYVSKSNKRKNRPRPSSKIEPGLASSMPPARRDQSSAAFESDDRRPSFSRQQDSAADANAHELLVIVPHVAEPSDTNESPADSVSSAPAAAKPTRAWMGKSSTSILIGDTFRMAALNRRVQSVASRPKKGALDDQPSHHFGFVPHWESDSYAEQVFGMNFWPADDLARTLIDIFFRSSNLDFPLFREADFRKRFRRRDFQADRGFHRVCLLIFALAATNGSFDSRTFAPTFSADPYAPTNQGRHSAGWIYYLQAVQRPRRHTVGTEVYDLQAAVLLTLFLSHSSSPIVCWKMLGEGVVSAYETGAHRGGLGTEATENDLLRRAFWCLFILDAQLSISLGRAPLIALSTFDAPLPIQSSATAGEDLPLTALYQLVKLAQLLRTTASSLYSFDSHLKSRTWVTAQISALNAEADVISSNLPESLRWSPGQPDLVKGRLSTAIQLMLTQTLLLINRPSMPNWRTPKAPPLSSTSFDIALASARKAVLVSLDYSRSDRTLPPLLIHCQDSAATIALALLGATAAGIVIDEDGLIAVLQDCWRAMSRGQELWITTAASISWVYSLLGMLDAAPDDAPLLSITRPTVAGIGAGVQQPSSQQIPQVGPQQQQQHPMSYLSSTNQGSSSMPDIDFVALYRSFAFDFGPSLGFDDGATFDFELGGSGGGGMSGASG